LNSLPDELKSIISAYSFAKHLKKFMTDKSLVPLYLYFYVFSDILCIIQ